MPGDRIARLAKTIKILKLPKDNHVDAAIAVLDKNTLASALILPKVGKLASTTTVPAVEKMKVHKHGRTTGYTQGQVMDVTADVNVQYHFGVARFVDQIIIVGDDGSFSDSGDSGSLYRGPCHTAGDGAAVCRIELAHDCESHRRGVDCPWCDAVRLRQSPLGALRPPVTLGAIRMASENRLRDIKRQISAALLDTPGVSGVGVRAGRVMVYLERNDPALKARAKALADARAPGVELQFEVAGRFGKQ